MTNKPRLTHDLTTRAGRVRAWLHFYLKDHQILRVLWWNLHQIAPDVWRSNQPSRRRLAHYKHLGIRSVVSLRGSQKQSFNLFEAEACAKMGLSFDHIMGLSAYALPTRALLLGAIDGLATVQRPFVIHCKSGADRTGFLAALYLICFEDVPVAQASQQLARRYIHFPRSKAGVLDHVFRVYSRDAELNGQGFRDWLETGYDPDAIKADFQNWRAGAGRWAE